MRSAEWTPAVRLRTPHSAPRTLFHAQRSSHGEHRRREVHRGRLVRPLGRDGGGRRCPGPRGPGPGRRGTRDDRSALRHERARQGREPRPRGAARQSDGRRRRPVGAERDRPPRRAAPPRGAARSSAPAGRRAPRERHPPPVRGARSRPVRCDRRFGSVRSGLRVRAAADRRGRGDGRDHWRLRRHRCCRIGQAGAEAKPHDTGLRTRRGEHTRCRTT